MTVREVLWNSNPQHPDKGAAWGVSTTVACSAISLPFSARAV